MKDIARPKGPSSWLPVFVVSRITHSRRAFARREQPGETSLIRGRCDVASRRHLTVTASSGHLSVLRPEDGPSAGELSLTQTYRSSRHLTPLLPPGLIGPIPPLATFLLDYPRISNNST